MMSTIPSIAPLDIKSNPSNIGERWKRWLQRFENYLIASSITTVERKTAMMLHLIGEDVYDIFLSLPDPPIQNPPLDQYEQTKLKLRKYLEPKINTEFEIYKFREAKQHEHETIDQFYSRLLKLAETCGFGDNKNNEIKSQIILNTRNRSLRKYALSEQPNLEQLLTKGRTIETTSTQIGKIEESENRTEQTNKVGQNRFYKNKHNKHRQNDKHNKEVNGKCKNCGNNWHPGGREECPARNVQCRACKKQGHFAKVCLSKTYTKKTPRKVNYTNVSNDDETSGESSSDQSFNITLNTVNNTEGLPTAIVQIRNKPVRFIIDTGTSVNIINEHTFNEIFPKTFKLTKQTTPIYAYNSREPLKTKGKLRTSLQYKTRRTEAEIIVTKGNAEPLISYRTAKELKLVKLTYNNKQIDTNDVDEIEQKFPDLFKGIGKLKDIEVKLHIDNNIEPIAQTTRKIPFHLRDKVEKELERLEKADIIEKASGPTSWISPIVVVPKGNDHSSIRLCIDMRMPNKAIKRERHQTPTFDDILTKLNGAKFFSKIDLREGYHQLILQEQSRHVTTFATHVGLYRYKRLNFGINMASETFQNTIRKTLQHVTNAINVSDDILVFGKTEEEHDRNLRKTLETLQTKGLTVNKAKCRFKTSSIKFLGYIFSSEGVRPDPQKIEAIEKITPPINATEVRSFLGMINFVGKFLPNLAEHTVNLRKLTHSKTSWQWTNVHEQEFEQIKAALKDVGKLAYFDVNKETHVHVDAGPAGLGAVLSQRHEDNLEITAYGSRSLTNTEQAYSHIEKEMLAIAWALDHFRVYLLGNHFILHTDHKPLTYILKDPRTAPSARIERLVLKTQQYSFTPMHQDGKTNPADYLSRHPIEGDHPEPGKTERYIAAILHRNMPTKLTTEEVERCTEEDSTLQKLKLAIKNDSHELWNDPSLKQYKPIKYELAIYKDIIMRGQRIVIPAALQPRAIELAHRGHQGMTKTKQLLRSKVWFPNIDKKTEEKIEACVPCQATDARKRRDPIQVEEIPQQPFTNLDIDFAGPFPNQKYVVLIIDEYSRFPFIETISSTSFKCLKSVLQKTFALIGFPKRIKSDNGPPFNGQEFEQYLHDLGIKHQRITPEWPEANGMVERLVKTLKRSLICANIETNKFDSQLQDFLLNYRSTPHSTTSIPPFELIYKWQVNDFLPTIRKRNKERQNTDQEKREKGKTYADKKRRTQENKLHVGDTVLCKQRKKNTLTPRYDPKPFTVTTIEGTKITAEREDKCITRNASFFKALKSLQKETYHYPCPPKQKRKPKQNKPSPFTSKPETKSAPPMLLEVIEDDPRAEPARDEQRHVEESIPDDQSMQQDLSIEDQPGETTSDELDYDLSTKRDLSTEDQPGETTSDESDTDSFESVIFESPVEDDDPLYTPTSLRKAPEALQDRPKRMVRPPEKFSPSTSTGRK